MQRKTVHDFDQELLALFDAYVHGALDRRGFLDKAAKYAVGGVTAAMLLDQLSPKFLEAQVIKPEDPRIKVERLDYESPKGYGKMRGYLAQPAKPSGKLPGVLVVHENRGLNPHIEDVARRLAVDNFIAFAPTRCSRWAVTRAMKTRRARRFRSSIRRRRARISSRRSSG